MKKKDERKFERVDIPIEANVRIMTPRGKDMGAVVVLGHGGMMISTHQKFQRGKNYRLVLHDAAHEIEEPVEAKTRYCINDAVGFEYERLSAEAAVAIGIIIGGQLAKRRGPASAL